MQQIINKHCEFTTYGFAPYNCPTNLHNKYVTNLPKHEKWMDVTQEKNYRTLHFVDLVEKLKNVISMHINKIDVELIKYCLPTLKHFKGSFEFSSFKGFYSDDNCDIFHTIIEKSNLETIIIENMNNLWSKRSNCHKLDLNKLLKCETLKSVTLNVQNVCINELMFLDSDIKKSNRLEIHMPIDNTKKNELNKKYNVHNIYFI